MAHRIAALTIALAVLLATPTTALVAPASSTTVSSPAPTAVCDTDTSCAAWDAAHGVVSDGGPGSTGLTADGHVADEDDPAFDCRYDGQGQCGPTADVGAPIVVTMPQGFRWVECSDPSERPTVNELGVMVCDYTPASAL